MIEANHLVVGHFQFQVIPAKAGIQSSFHWMPAFAGMKIIFYSVSSK